MRTVLILVVAVVCAPASVFGVSFDAAADFSATANPAGVWSYGFLAAPTDTLALYGYHRVVNGVDFWERVPGEGYPYVSHAASATTVPPDEVELLPTQVGVHPGQGGELSVVRWSAPISGLYRIQTGFESVDPEGGTVDVYVVQNQDRIARLALFDRDLNGFHSSVAFTTTLMLLSGDTLDFMVGFGRVGALNNYLNDGVALQANIQPVPEPGSLLLLGGGVAIGLLLAPPTHLARLLTRQRFFHRVPPAQRRSERPQKPPSKQ